MAIQRFEAYGDGNMGSVTNGTSVCRFTLGARQTIVSLKVAFDSGSGTADLTIKVDNHRGAIFDTTLWTLEDVGTGVNANFRIDPEDREYFTVDGRDEFVLEWTDPGTTNWAVEVTLENA